MDLLVTLTEGDAKKSCAESKERVRKFSRKNSNSSLQIRSDSNQKSSTNDKIEKNLFDTKNPEHFDR